MRYPYRVVVWGPGGLGRICIRELLKRADFSLVGVRAYNPNSEGNDVGPLVGISPIGLTAMTDVDQVLAIDCDCVLHLARDTGTYESLDDIVRILEAGRNVVTVHPYHHAAHMAMTNAPSDAMARIDAAAKKGKATFHATGIHPEFVCNRIAAAMTGLSLDVSNIKVEETWDVSFISFDHMDMLGFGRPPEYAKEQSPALGFTHNYCLQNLYGMASALDVDLVRTEWVHDYATADAPIQLPNILIKPGMVGRITHRYNGYTKIDQTNPFLTIEVNWMMGRAEMLPKDVHPDNYYVISIEGTPSLRVGIDIKPTVSGGAGLMNPDDPTSEPGYYATIATVLQAVPRVCRASPGVLEVVRQEVHWAPDFRSLSAA